MNSAIVRVKFATRLICPPVTGDFSSIAVAITFTKASNNSDMVEISLAFVIATAACDAKDSERLT